MADINTKKIKIDNSDLPPIDVASQGYTVRYRIISEDKNRTSHWSQIYTVKPEYTFVPGLITHNKAGDIITVAWNSVEIKKGTTKIKEASEYDIWLKWDRDDNGDWEYRSRINTTSISLLIPSTYKKNGIVQSNQPNHLSIEVFLPGTPISRSSSFLRVYQGGSWTV